MTDDIHQVRLVPLATIVISNWAIIVKTFTEGEVVKAVISYRTPYALAPQPGDRHPTLRAFRLVSGDAMLSVIGLLRGLQQHTRFSLGRFSFPIQVSSSLVFRDNLLYAWILLGRWSIIAPRLRSYRLLHIPSNTGHDYVIDIEYEARQQQDEVYKRCAEQHVCSFG
jgi:hypothetical protein